MGNWWLYYQKWQKWLRFRFGVWSPRFFETFPELPEANTPRWTSPTSHWSCPAFTLQVLQHMDGTTAVPPAALSMASGGAMVRISMADGHFMGLFVARYWQREWGSHRSLGLEPVRFSVGTLDMSRLWYLETGWVKKRGSSIIWVCSANEMSAGTLHELCTESFGNLSLAGRTKVLPVLNGSSRHLSRIDKNESSTWRCSSKKSWTCFHGAFLYSFCRLLLRAAGQVLRRINEAAGAYLSANSREG